jgi:hypothetical protein
MIDSECCVYKIWFYLIVKFKTVQKDSKNIWQRAKLCIVDYIEFYQLTNCNQYDIYESV